MTNRAMQTKFIRALIMSLTAMTCLSYAQEEYTQARYKVILDRAPFGEESAEDEKSTQQTAPAIVETSKDLRLSMLNKAVNGKMARAGIVNLTDKKSFMISVGERINGIKLLEIDIKNENASVERNGATFLLKLEKGKAKKTPPKRVIPTRTSSIRRRTPTPPREPKLKNNRQPTAEEREEIRENLRNYQMEVIRKGMPPLPIELTPEMDAQLVEEGVLPPNEMM